MAETSTGSVLTNTKKNPKKECKVIFTRRESAENRKRIEEGVSDEEWEEKNREESEKEKNEIKENSDEVSTTKTKTKSQLAREVKKEISSVPTKKVPYPLVLSKKDNERYFARFLDIFDKLKIFLNDLNLFFLIK